MNYSDNFTSNSDNPIALEVKAKITYDQAVAYCEERCRMRLREPNNAKKISLHRAAITEREAMHTAWQAAKQAAEAYRQEGRAKRGVTP